MTSPSADSDLAALLAQLPVFTSSHFDASGPVVEIGSEAELARFPPDALAAVLQAIKPWKKGPFRIFGTDIDAEWRSDLKWQRLLPHLGELAGQQVLDIGCHNGYYMFRMAAAGAAAVTGFEPVVKHWQTFQFLNRYAGRSELEFVPTGLDRLVDYPSRFDSVFCLGILYHHTDPIGVMRLIHSALVRGGQVFIDCQGIPGADAVALTPRRRYAGASGVWFLPTASCLETWLARANFRDIRWIHKAPLDTCEQRSTPWSPGKSLVDFLDPQNPEQTIEGYPAPWRYYLSARK